GRALAPSIALVRRRAEWRRRGGRGRRLGGAAFRRRQADRTGGRDDRRARARPRRRAVGRRIGDERSRIERGAPEDARGGAAARAGRARLGAFIAAFGGRAEFGRGGGGSRTRARRSDGRRARTWWP